MFGWRRHGPKAALCATWQAQTGSSATDPQGTLPAGIHAVLLQVVEELDEHLVAEIHADFVPVVPHLPEFSSGPRLCVGFLVWIGKQKLPEAAASGETGTDQRRPLRKKELDGLPRDPSRHEVLGKPHVMPDTLHEAV